MVVDVQFPTCPVRNVLSRLCEPDALWVIQLLGKSQTLTQNDFKREFKGLEAQEIITTLTHLKEDNIIVEDHKCYRLSSLGTSLLPAIQELITWCKNHQDSFQSW